MTGNPLDPLCRPRWAVRSALVLIVLALSPAWIGAQLSDGPVSGTGGPLSERSTNVGVDSAPVYEPRRSLSDAGDGTLSGDPVRGSITGDLVSGPVSDVSSGPVTEHQPVSGGGSVGAASIGSVKKDLTSPLREMTSEPVRDLAGLQQQLRAIQPLPRNPQPEEATAEQPTAEQPAAADEATRDTAAEPSSEPVQVAEPEEHPVEVPEASAPTPVLQPPEQEPPADDAAEPAVEQPPAVPEPEIAAEGPPPPAEEATDQPIEAAVDATPAEPEAAPQP